MKNTKIMLLTGIILLLFSCKHMYFFNEEISYIDGPLKVKIKLIKAKYKKASGNLDNLFIYGLIIINNTSDEVVKYNINDYQLILNGKYVSTKPYIDSIASILINDEELANGETIEKNIYWVFSEESGAYLPQKGRLDLKIKKVH